MKIIILIPPTDSHQFQVNRSTQFHGPTSSSLPTTDLSALPANTESAPPVVVASTDWSWRLVLVTVWFAGFALLIIRLAGARLLLWRMALV